MFWLLLFVVGPSVGCVLCPLRLPPRPRSIDHFQLPSFDDVAVPESADDLCNATRRLPFSAECRRGVERIFCSLASLIDAKTTDCGDDEEDNGDQAARAERCALCERSRAKKVAENFWVITWLDSVGKMPAAVSEGNHFWLGDYEQCLQLKESGVFEGQYCLVQLEVPDSQVQRSCPQPDPLEIHLGLCAPFHCTVDEITALVQSNSPYRISVRCESSPTWPLSSQIFMSSVVIWITVILAATAVDVYGSGNAILDHTTKLSRCLSLYTNGRESLRTKRGHNYHSVQGIQVLSVAVLVTGNCYAFMMPYIENVIFSYSSVRTLPMHPLNNYTFHTDALIAVNSMFTSLLLWDKLLTTFDIKKHYAKRLIQVLPGYAFLVLFMKLLFDRLSSGPLWNHSELIERCDGSWWKNILFINNLFTPRETCLDGGYLFGLEAQFFFILALVVYLTRKYRTVLFWVVGISLVASILYVFCEVYSHSLPPSIVLTAHPLPEKQMEMYIDRIFTKPWSRAPACIIGFLCSFLCKSRARINKAVSFVLWVSMLVVGLFVFFALYPYAAFGSSSPLFLALYAAFHRPLWSLIVCATVCLCCRGCAGELGVFLEWRVFAPLAKLAYIVFLICEPIFLFLFSSMHRPLHATHWSTLYMALGTFVLSYLIAFLVDVFVARPVRNVLVLEFSGPLQRRNSASMCDRVVEEQPCSLQT